jgi:DNA polymerase-3 subunit epsilon
MIVTLLDFETVIVDPVDPRKMPPIELGAILFDTAEKKIIRAESFLMWDNENELYHWTDQIEEITGISLAHLLEFSISPSSGLVAFCERFLQYSVCLIGDDAEKIPVFAHNAVSFDKVVFELWAAQYGAQAPEHLRELINKITWVDTLSDIPYPKNITTRKLSYLAAELGFVNPFPHRALPDTMTMMRVASHFDMDQAIVRSLQPKVTCVADCKQPWKDSAPEGKKEVDFAKERGYKFDATRKMWTKVVLASEVEDEKQACAHRFRVGTITPKE